MTLTIQNIDFSSLPQLQKIPISGSVLSALFYLKFQLSVPVSDQLNSYEFNGQAGGFSTPGAGSLYGDLYIIDEKIFQDTVSFQFNAAVVYCSVLFFDKSSKLLGHAQFGGVSTVAGIGGGTGNWTEK